MNKRILKGLIICSMIAVLSVGCGKAEPLELKQDMFKDNVTALSQVTLTIDDKAVDYNKVGKYKATLTAKDASENENRKEISVVTNEKEKPKEEVKQTNSNKTQNSQNNISNNSNSNKKPSNNNNTNTNNSGNKGTGNSGNNNTNIGNNNSNNNTNNKPNKPTPSPEKPKPPKPPKYEIGNSGKLFDAEAEAIAWAEQYMIDHIEEICGYLWYSTYDKYTVEFDYR